METEPEYFNILIINTEWSQKSIMILATCVILLIFIIISALFSFAEKVFSSLKPSLVDEFEKSGDRGLKRVARLLEKPAELITSIIISESLINISVVVITFFLASMLSDVLSHPLSVFFITFIISTLILFFTNQILPGIYAGKVSHAFYKFISIPVMISEKIFKPLSYLMLLLKRNSSNAKNILVSEISDALELNEKEASDEKNILKGIVKFGNIYVREIMTSRVDVVSVEIGINFRKLISIIINSGYSRIPVYENNFDNIKGILYIKDLIPYINKADDFDWQTLLRTPYFVPETKKIDDLLKEFQKSKIHFAIVVDEYGGSSGIVTLEDILEEIVGEITDETDEDEKIYSKIDAENYLFEGKVYLNDFYKILEVEEDIFNDIKGDADTLAGLILEMKGEFPRKNEIIKFDNFEFKIVSVDSRRIKKIQVTVKK